MSDPRLSSVKLADCEFSVRTTSCLTYAGFVTLADVAEKTDDELRAIKNFGRRSLNEVREVIESFKTRSPETARELKDRYGISFLEAAKILHGEALMRRLQGDEVHVVLRQIIMDLYPRRPNA